MNFNFIYGHTLQKSRLETLFARGMIPQTMLFTGMTGTGKFLLANRFLSALFCTAEIKPCLACEHCRQIQKDIHPDFITIKPNERGIIPIGSEEKREPGSVRWLIDRLSRKSISGATGVIIDGIDRVTEEGQNALLKSIEEPAFSTHVILIAQGKARVLPTIVSRAIEFSFNALRDDAVLDILQNNDSDPSESHLAAFFAGGSAGRALLLADASFREMLFALCGGISSALNTRGALVIPNDLPGKLVTADVLADVLLNVYRKLLQCELTGEGIPREVPRAIRITDGELASSVIKILLALKQGQSHNLNFRIALKGLLYSLYSGREQPGIESFSLTI